LLATVRDRGLYATIIGTDIAPTTTAMTALTNEWNDRNNSSYNQILLCISPELQTAIDDTDVANEAWKILIKKFESTDPSKISIIQTKYKNYHMVEGQSVASYLTTMRDFRNQLKKMGEVIADSTHAATVLRNIPESWRPISQTIRMITCIPDEIEERLEAHEADLNALEISSQAATTFVAQSRPAQTTQPRMTYQPNPYRSNTNQPNAPKSFQKPTFTCNNCGKTSHSSAQCYAIGGGLEGQAPWTRNNEQKHTFTCPPNAFTSQVTPRSNLPAKPVQEMTV